MASFGIDMMRFQGKPTRSIRKPGLLIPRYTLKPIGSGRSEDGDLR